MFAISLFLSIHLVVYIIMNGKIHRAFNTFYLPAKNPFRAVEGGCLGAEFVANIPDTKSTPG